ncbi:hypothetical protein [Bradyrhizobium sp.]|jgi:ABC-type phosphate transport system permease subunit|uniref:hypothetical protein n=1 Tax=Bradyrhizobium sp. TaxID=376 RepID=UPI003C2A23C9
MSSIVDLTIISVLGTNRVLMAAIPVGVLVGLFGAAVIFAFVPDAMKSVLYHRLGLA